MNILNLQFQIEQPNRVWAGDITYVWTWLYFAVVLNLYVRTVIGWAMGDRGFLRAGPHMALAHRKPTTGLRGRSKGCS